MKKIKIDNLYFQYIPDEFFKEVYPGDEKDMMSLLNSPHYRFLKLYQEIGNEIWDCYNDTDYIHLMKLWGRKDKYNRQKVRKFIQTYKDIKKNGLKKKIVVLNVPLHKKFFDVGYEIWHGHHRASICKILNYNKVPFIVKKKVSI